MRALAGGPGTLAGVAGVLGARARAGRATGENKTPSPVHAGRILLEQFDATRVSSSETSVSESISVSGQVEMVSSSSLSSRGAK